MRRAALLALVPLLLGGALPQRPVRIMSLMVCNDLLLLSLVPRDRIASITFLAHDAAAALMPGRDAGVPVNHGLSEEILRQKPDLILAGPYSTPTARRLAQAVGAPIVDVAPASSFAEIRATTLKVGRLVGEPARARALVARMDATLARLAATRPRRMVRLVAWNGSGSVPGRGTLTDAIITAAGATNIAAGDAGYSSFGVEELLRARPDAILKGEDRWTPPSLEAARSDHPLVQRLYAGRRIAFPDAAYGCGLPQSADAAVALRAALARLPRGGVRW